MGIAFQIISVILIIGAVLLFWKNSSRNTMITKAQRALAVFQIVLCGGVPFTDCVRPIGFTSKKAKAYPDDCLLQRCIDCGTVLCFSI